MTNFEDVEFSSLSNETAKVDAVAGISIVTSLLSFLGSGSVLVCSLYHRKVLYPEIFPTFHLAVADLLASVSVIVSSVMFLVEVSHGSGSDAGCKVISGLVTSFYTSAFLLTIVYALEALFRFKRKLRNDTSLESLPVSPVSSRWMYVVYAFAWLAPLIAAGLLIARTSGRKSGTCSMCFADFRFDEQSCWTEEEQAFLQYLTKLIFLAPLVLAVVINMVLYIFVLRTYKHVVMSRGLLSYHQRQEERMLQRKTFLYQAVFFVCWLPSIILGSASFTEDYTSARYYPALVMQVLLGPLQGLLNSIVYGWQRGSFRQALTERSSLLSTNRSSTMSVTL